MSEKQRKKTCFFDLLFRTGVPSAMSRVQISERKAKNFSRFFFFCPFFLENITIIPAKKLMGCRQAVRHRTLTPALRWFESNQSSSSLPWRNWQTRQTQNLLLSACGFKSHGKHGKKDPYLSWLEDPAHNRSVQGSSPWGSRILRKTGRKRKPHVCNSTRH